MHDYRRPVAPTADPAAADRPRRAGEYVGLSAGSTALIVGAVVTAWLLRGAFVAAHRTVGWVVACAVVALLIDPLVGALDKRLPRAVAVVAVLLGILAVLGAVGFGVVREMTDSLDELRTALPEAAEELETRYDWAAEVGVADRVGAFVEDLDESVRGDAVSEAASTLPTFMVTGILMLFLLAGGRKYLHGFLSQLGERRRAAWRSVIVGAARRGREWLLWSIGFAIVSGVVVGTAAWALDLPAAISLGLVAGVLSLLPMIGLVVGGLPAALLAFGLSGWRDGATVVAVVLALQVVEQAVVRPWIERRSLRVGPAVPILVALLGFELYGGGGAAYAVALGVIGLAALDQIGQRGDEPAPAR